MKFDYDILFGFLSESDRKRFRIWDNVFISGKSIIATYRAPFEDHICIPISDYKSKVRESKIDQIVGKI